MRINMFVNTNTKNVMLICVSLIIVLSLVDQNYVRIKFSCVIQFEKRKEEKDYNLLLTAPSIIIQ